MPIARSISVRLARADSSIDCASEFTTRRPDRTPSRAVANGPQRVVDRSKLLHLAVGAVRDIGH